MDSKRYLSLRLVKALKYGKYVEGGELYLDGLFCQLSGNMGVKIDLVISWTCLGYSIELRG